MKDSYSLTGGLEEVQSGDLYHDFMVQTATGLTMQGILAKRSFYPEDSISYKSKKNTEDLSDSRLVRSEQRVCTQVS